MQYTDKHGCSTITGVVTDKGGQCGAIAGARITVSAGSPAKRGEVHKEVLFDAKTDSTGRYEICDVPEGIYQVNCTAFGLSQSKEVTVERGCPSEVSFQLKINLRITTLAYAGGCDKLEPCGRGVTGQAMVARVESSVQDRILFYKWNSRLDVAAAPASSGRSELEFTPRTAGTLHLGVTAMASRPDDAAISGGDEAEVSASAEARQ